MTGGRLALCSAAPARLPRENGSVDFAALPRGLLPRALTDGADGLWGLVTCF